MTISRVKISTSLGREGRRCKFEFKHLKENVNARFYTCLQHLYLAWKEKNELLCTVTLSTSDKLQSQDALTIQLATMHNHTLEYH